MPKKSKIPVPTKAPRSAPDKSGAYQCVRCGREFTRRPGNFHVSQSSLYRANNGYLPVCMHCVNDAYEHYQTVLGSEREAMRRICMKFDIYWNENVFEAVSRSNAVNSRISTYIRNSNLRPNSGKTYDDTLDEEAEKQVPAAFESDIRPDEDIENVFIVTDEVKDFWGAGLEPSFYAELEKRYKYWTASGGKKSEDLDIGERAVIRQICMLEVTIARDTANGKPIDKSINSLNTLLGSANLKPVQKKEGADSSLESNPFGMWIRKIEDTRPIPEASEEFKDVDGIAKYISVWFLGHLCKMLKINNKYSYLYEEEMERLRVARPEYEGESEDTILEDIFDRANRAEEDDAPAEGV